MTKRIFSVILVIATVLLCLVAVSSCNLGKKNEHVHDYKMTPTAPTCTEAGVNTFTCDCGESYTEAGEAALGHNMVDRKGHEATCTEAGYADYKQCTRCNESTKVETAALGHNYLIEAITYPTFDTEGERTVKCSRCDASNTQKIQANSQLLPPVSQILGALIGEISVKAEANEVFFVNANVRENDTDGYNYMNFTAVKLGEFSLATDEDGLPVGYFKLELLRYEHDANYETDFDAVEPDYERLGEMYFYLNGDVLSMEIIDPSSEVKEQEFELTTMFYAFVAQATGMGVDNFNKLVYLAGEFGSVADDLLKLVEGLMAIELPAPSEQYNEAYAALINSVLEGVILETELENGNVEYRTNVKALKALIEELEGHTYATYLNKIMGEGTAESLRDFAKSLPTMKLKEIANFAISFAEETGMDTDAVFSFVDLAIFVATEKSVCTKDLLEEHYDDTLSTVIGAEEEALSQAIANVADQFFTVTFEQALGADFDDIKAMLDQLDEVAQLTFVLDAEGNFVSLHAEADDNIVIDIDTDSFSVNVYTTIDGEQYTLVDLDGVIENGEIVSFTLDVNMVNNILGDMDVPVDGVPGEDYSEENPAEAPVAEVETEEPTVTVEDLFEATYESGTLTVTADDLTLTVSVTDDENGTTLDASVAVGEEEIITLVIVDNGEGNLTLSFAAKDGEEILASADLVYNETYTETGLDAELSINSTLRGFDLITFTATIDDDVLLDASLVVNTIEEIEEWVDGYYETTWVEGHYEDVFEPVFDEYGNYIGESYVETIYVDGHYEELWFDGYYKGTGEYEISNTVVFSFTNVDGVLTLDIGDGEQVYTSIVAKVDDEGLYTLTLELSEGPTFVVGAQQVDNGVRLVFEIPAFEAGGVSEYFDGAGYDENGVYFENWISYNYRNYIAVLFDIYLEINFPQPEEVQ